jgi:hypothetical protein
MFIFYEPKKKKLNMEHCVGNKSEFVKKCSRNV